MRYAPIFFILSFILMASCCYCDNPPSPPSEISISDTPNDDGSSIQLKWKISSDDGKGENDVVSYTIMRSSEPKNMKVIRQVEARSKKYVDTKLKRNNPYYYVIQVKDKSGNTSDSSIIGPAIPTAQWFNRNMIPAGIGIVVFAVILLFWIYYARSGKQVFIRRIAGLDAIDESIGRATEMGRSILYISGTGSIRSVATIASMNILSRVARMIAEYNIPLNIPCNDPVVMNIEREIVQNAHLDAGHPDTYNQDSIYFVAEEQFAYAAAVDGIIMRERPATIFYMGAFLAESLVFSEVGSHAGAVQIAGTDSITQLPFFITTCDYTLMGEELYAASAYLSKEPLLLGSLKGQDWGKLLVIATILIGVVTQLLGFNWFTDLLNMH
ncbi:MAG: Fibronectin type protein [Candidatus Poribacteria bacterium]|nr:Fibronectin type protein [Candidatus Poribacteria bacterium]